MKFSIITPSYNQGRFISDCIESVRCQTGSFDVEHIVIDAGSTDETTDILKQHPHLDWVSEPDQGMSDGINKGFLQASGDWLMWLNCDDYLLPEALEKVARFIKQHPTADVVHGDCVFVKEDKSVIRRKFDTAVDTMDLLFVGCVIPSTSSFYSRRIIESGELLSIDYKNCMDREFYLRLITSGFEFAYLPLPIAHFRWYEESTTSLNWQRMIDESIRCRRNYIDRLNLPAFLKARWILELMRRILQIRRIAKRILTHGRIR